MPIASGRRAPVAVDRNPDGPCAPEASNACGSDATASGHLVACVEKRTVSGCALVWRCARRPILNVMRVRSTLPAPSRLIRAACCSLLAALSLCAAQPVFGAMASRETDGVLVLAHGGSAAWNRTVARTVRQARLNRPTEIAFGMGMHRHEVAGIQQAIDTLERRAARRIIVVPLLVSSASDLMRQFEYLLGLRDRGPWEADARPVTLRVPILVTRALDDDPVVSEILLDRARRLSRDPSEESVVLVAHGPTSDEDDARWLQAMERIAERVRAAGRFRSVIGVTMRDDAPPDVLDEATRQMREAVERGSGPGRTLVVPLLLSRGGVESKIPERLGGLTYRYRAQALLPHRKLARWIADRVQEASADERRALLSRSLAPVARAEGL